MATVMISNLKFDKADQNFTITYYMSNEEPKYKNKALYPSPSPYNKTLKEQVAKIISDILNGNCEFTNTHDSSFSRAFYLSFGKAYDKYKSQLQAESLWHFYQDFSYTELHQINQPLKNQILGEIVENTLKGLYDLKKSDDPHVFLTTKYGEYIKRINPKTYRYTPLPQNATKYPLSQAIRQAANHQVFKINEKDLLSLRYLF